jgi:uncharacterized protein (TIGR03118 family)
LPSAGFVQTNLTADTVGPAANSDPHLINPWGLAYSPTFGFWVSDNNAGVATLLDSTGSPGSLVVTIPHAAGSTQGSPTGTVFNSSGSGFDVTVSGTPTPAVFLFATADGTISAWAGGNSASIIPSATPPSTFKTPAYFGLTMDTDSIGRNLLYASDAANNTIDVYDSNFNFVTDLTGTFSDPAARGYTIFNIQNLGGLLYVTYSKNTGVGGLVDVFNSDGVLQQHLIQNNGLNEPWGIALAPSNFGSFSNDLIVGNNGDGFIHAYNPHNGQFAGTMTNTQGKALVIPDVWALKFGNGGGAGPRNTLFFTSGVNPANENHGLFGSIGAVATIPTRAPIVPNLANTAVQSFSTVPPNGDGNPYGVAFVPNNLTRGTGPLAPGDILVSNFNSSSGVQGTGTTIVQIHPGTNAQPTVFFTAPAGQPVGLTTALTALSSGFVIVGNVPTATVGGTLTAQTGSLMIIDRTGKLVLNLTNAMLDSPWDLTVGSDKGNSAVIYVSNAISGTVTRLTLKLSRTGTGTPTVASMVQIGKNFGSAPNSAAVIVGPTGLAYNAHTDTLYVASTDDNGIFAIAGASKLTAATTVNNGKGTQLNTSSLPLNGPLGLVLAPNGDLIVTNGDAINTTQTAPPPNLIIEFNPTTGKLVGETPVDPGAGGAAFGIAISTFGGETRFAAVDDNTNSVDEWTFA